MITTKGIKDSSDKVLTMYAEYIQLREEERLKLMDLIIKWLHGKAHSSNS